MSDYFYKSTAPAVVAIVRDFYTQKDALSAGLLALGKLFGGAVAPMRDITSHYAGGVKLSASRELDVHWCRPDDYGYRSLRTAAKPAKGMPKDERAAIRAEHERLRGLWSEHCPPRLRTLDYWGQLGVNTGNLMMCGGIKFELDGIAYFNLGFDINKAEHEADIAASKPTAGWIEGAAEILASEFEAARTNKLEQKKEVTSA
jgi:hypothetical protein